jgi:hypothetical protein
MSQIPTQVQTPSLAATVNAESAVADKALDDMLNATLGQDANGGEQQANGKDEGGEDAQKAPEISGDDQVKMRLKLSKAGYDAEFIEEVIKDNPKLAKSLALQEEARQKRENRGKQPAKPDDANEGSDTEGDETPGDEDQAGDEGEKPRRGQQEPAKGYKARVMQLEAMLDDPEVAKEFKTFTDDLNPDGAKSFKRGLVRVLSKLGVGDQVREAVNRLRSEVKATQQLTRGVVLDAVRRELSSEWPSLATEAKWKKVEGHVTALQESPAYRDTPIRDLVRMASTFTLGDESKLVEQQKREALRSDRRGGSTTLAGKESAPSTPGAKSVDRAMDKAMDAAIEGASQAEVDATFRRNAPTV